MRLAAYYGFFLDNTEKRNRGLQIHYYKIAATHGSQGGIEMLIATYSRSTDRFNLSKAYRWRRELKRLATQRNIQIESDAEWYYNLYSEYFVARRSTLSKRNKKLGLYFLERAASLGLKEAQRELIEIYSKDPDLRNPKKARYWEQRLVASKLAPTQTLALISNSTEHLPVGATRTASTEFTPVKILGKEGMIVPAAFLRNSGLPAEGFWTPKESQLREMERSLPTFLRREMQSRPSVRALHEVIASEPRYRRQYVGMIMDGRKVIWVNCIPQKSEEGVDPFTNWKREIVDVSDGGSSFRGVVYDTEKHSFDKLILNGSAQLDRP